MRPAILPKLPRGVFSSLRAPTFPPPAILRLRRRVPPLQAALKLHLRPLRRRRHGCVSGLPFQSRSRQPVGGHSAVDCCRRQLQRDGHQRYRQRAGAARVVANKIGLFTQDSTGGGLALVQNYFSATVVDLNRLTTGSADGVPFRPPNPGDFCWPMVPVSGPTQPVIIRFRRV